MPTKNKRLTLEQRVCAIEWEAHAEKLSHFLRGTLGHPTLEPQDLSQFFDDVETALHQLRRAFELMPPPAQR